MANRNLETGASFQTEVRTLSEKLSKNHRYLKRHTGYLFGALRFPQPGFKDRTTFRNAAIAVRVLIEETFPLSKALQDADDKATQTKTLATLAEKLLSIRSIIQHSDNNSTNMMACLDTKNFYGNLKIAVRLDDFIETLNTFLDLPDELATKLGITDLDTQDKLPIWSLARLGYFEEALRLANPQDKVQQNIAPASDNPPPKLSSGLGEDSSCSFQEDLPTGFNPAASHSTSSIPVSPAVNRALGNQH